MKIAKIASPIIAYKKGIEVMLSIAKAPKYRMEVRFTNT
jgi:hypothetical protein